MYTTAPLPPLQMGKFKASMTIVRESWSVLMQDREIMWFPILSAIVNLIALAFLCTLGFFGVLQGDMGNWAHLVQNDAGAFSYIILFVYYLVTFFIVNFFQAGIYLIVHARFSGQDMSFQDGINGAIEHSGKIFVWSFISATVGVLLRMIADRSRLIGKIVAFFLGAAWNILTYFSLPSLIIGKTTVLNSFKDSAAVIRKNWGETIIVNLGVNFFFSMLIFLELALGIGIIILVPTLVVGTVVVAFFLISIVLLTIISSALASIFNLALYEYATTGKVPSGFSPELIQHAVKVK